MRATKQSVQKRRAIIWLTAACVSTLHLVQPGWAIAGIPEPINPPPAFILEWGGQGSLDGQFFMPQDLTVDGEGNIYVADGGNARIQKFNRDGDFVTKWGGGDPYGDYGFAGGLTDVQAGPDGLIYTLDGQSIKAFTKGGVFARRIDLVSGFADGQFRGPGRFAIASDGTFFVTDIESSRVQRLSTSGAFMAKWGTFGEGPGQFDHPNGIALDQIGNVLVVDWSRLQRFTTAGQLIEEIGGGPGLIRPFGVACDGGGNIYVTDWVGVARAFLDSGTLLARWGSSGSGPNQFHNATGTVVDGEGSIYVCDMSNHRIQKFASVNGPTPTIPTTWGRIKALYR